MMNGGLVPNISGDGVSLDAGAPKALLSIGLVDDLSRLSRKSHDQEHLSDHVTGALVSAGVCGAWPERVTLVRRHGYDEL